MEVVLTEDANKSLQYIYHYYLQEASEDMAQKIMNRLFDRIESLSAFPKRGRIEAALSSLNQQHRYVVEGDYKIIYLVGDKIIVTDVFNTRQDPYKILKRSK